jgi:hypothetical protein
VRDRFTHLETRLRGAPKGSLDMEVLPNCLIAHPGWVKNQDPDP